MGAPPLGATMTPRFGLIGRWGNVPVMVICPDHRYPRDTLYKTILLADASETERVGPGEYPAGTVISGNFSLASPWQVRPEDNE